MLKIHRTAEGNEMLIAEMETDHLHNTIRLKLYRILKRRQSLAQTSGLNEYEAGLYGVKRGNVEQVAYDNRQDIGSLYPYLAEMYLRNDFALVELVQKAVGRNGQLGTISLLTEGNVTDAQIEQLLGSINMEEQNAD